MEEPSMTVDELYLYIIKHLTPEEALKRMLVGTVDQYKELRKGEGGQPEMIIAAAAFELGWDLCIEKDHEMIRGLSVGTKEYLNSIFKDE